MQDWRWMTAADLGRRIGSREIDPVDLTKVFLTAIDEHEHRDRIYARVTPKRALAEAQAASARAKAGLRRSALDGVPISWKDLFDTAGTATEAGTLYLKDRIPSRDAEVLRNATAMGLVCLGKTHMTEIAFSGLGLNPITATPPSVNDPDVVPGGSSSGAAASVAFGLAAAAVGSDTGGSVRVPSVWNDLVGLKTTHGLLSLKGVVPLCKTFDTVGPLCRSVEDAALMLGALGGCAADIKGSDLSGVRLAILDTIAMENVREDPKAAFMAAVVRLEEAGAEVEHVRFEPLRRAFELAGILYTVDAYAYWRDIIEADPSKMYHQILARIRAGAEFDAVDFVAGWAELNEIRAEYHAAMAGFDAVIMPTSPILPPNAKRLEEDGEFFVQENLMTLRNTRVGNLMGECSLTLPTGVPSCGIMLNAAPMSEARLLRIGAAAERALA
jgi:aspartyl-tRNA(Asn)/glutamyl-tRNA(Gln) amidotransferase subunit A